MKGPICGVENCRSKNYEEGEDGFLYCQNGHRQHGLVRGADDEDNFMNATRTVTRKKRDTEDVSKGLTKNFSGRQALDLYLKCLQLILRHQLWFLVKGRGLPAELEAVVFDLWALRIAQFGDKIANTQRESDSQSQSQTYNTLEAEDDPNDAEKKKAKSRKPRDQTLASLPNLGDCLCLCYLGILTLRLPFTPGDLLKWVVDRKLCYLGAIKTVPLPMRDRLPPTYHSTLDPRAVFKYARFYERLVSLQIGYTHDHGIIWPALNSTLLLHRYLTELALPLEVYDTTTRLSKLLGYNFTLRDDDKIRAGVKHLPEAQVIGCLVVSIKLLYPFDVNRHSTRPVDPLAMPMDWESWRKQMATTSNDDTEESRKYTSEELLNISENDAFHMQADQMDQYLDFYADAFLDHAEIQRTKDTNDFRRALYDMFPIDEATSTPGRISDSGSLQHKLDLVRAVQGSMKVEAATAESAGNGGSRVGQGYVSWKKEEEMPEHAKMFYQSAAKLVGLSMEMLILAVSSVEARIEQWTRRQGREMRVDELGDDRAI